MKRSTHAPAMLQGKPVACRAILPVRLKGGFLMYPIELRSVDGTDVASRSGGRAAEGRPDAIRIRADREVPVGLLVQVIDEVRLGGIRNLSIVAERR